MLNPSDLDFPKHFDSFRDCQHEAFEYCLTSEKQYCALGMPPGSGKSGIAYGLSKLFGGRTIILTATHGLEDQYTADFNTKEHIRIDRIRGRRNYVCWEGGNCDDGRRAGCADKEGCPYLAELRVFNACNVGITNYAWWLAVNAQAAGIPKPDTLICDESHLIPEWLASSLNFRLNEKELRALKCREKPSEDIEEWRGMSPNLLQAAFDNHNEAQQVYGKIRLRSTEDAYRLRKAEELYDKMYRLSKIDRDADNWIITKSEGEDEGRVWRFEVIWPGMYKARLFQGVKRVILMSATLRPKTLQYIGLKRSEVDFREWDRQFPAVNGPVIWIPTAKMRHGMDNEDRQRWIDRHREIYTWGSDRKGLSHTVSYDRARQLNEALGDTFPIVLNGAADPESQTATDAFKKFIWSSAYSVLVSPSFSTGWDFSGQRAEWQTISKIAFPPTNDKIIAARTEQDSDYPAYVAVQDLVQACGRLNRYRDDRGTTLIVDDAVGSQWFKRAIKDHAPRWFNVRREEVLPMPLEKL